MPLVKDYKELVLPTSKTKLTLRKMRPYDYTFTGEIPDTFAGWEKKDREAKAAGGKLEAKISDFTAKEVLYIAKVVERAVVKVHQGKASDPLVRIVAKQPAECAPTEFSFFDLDAADVDALVSAVFDDGEGAGQVPASFLQ